MTRIANGQLDVIGQVWICKTCGYCGPVFHADEGEYIWHLKRNKIQRSNVISKYKIGRNLRALTADMDGKSLQEKVEIFERSYGDERYY